MRLTESVFVGTVHSFRPKLILNQLFVRDFVQEKAPCFALGLVEERGHQTGFITIKPDRPIPDVSSDQGFSLGHRVLGHDRAAVFQFVFHFYDFLNFNALVNPDNPLVQQVLSIMLETGDHFFFAFKDRGLSAFRTQFAADDFVGLKSNMDKFGHLECNDVDYENVVSEFQKKPEPEGPLLTWVCHDNPDYLDLKKYPFELNPA